ncbi:hypothetical protein EVAR_91738_1 [Eumeta japonica]|uniref:RNase H type-1 domain-containing protein n=1 Tax=Eumeta variegata TaxID=151549 RepID=A0A4C1SBM5_EUMVA|nr:hypothetical protein EVAR_91738_1 [Eumeta japonica]
MSIEYELIDESDPDPLGNCQPKSTRTAAKLRVGAYRPGRTIQESPNSVYIPSCSVYQAEMYALYRAVAMVEASREKVVNILSDSRSSLELLSNPRRTSIARNKESYKKR